MAASTVALFGRFSPGARERLKLDILARKGRTVRDLTRASDMFVVGAQAMAHIDSGALAHRLEAAERTGARIFGERAFAAMLREEAGPEPTLPLATALGPTRLKRRDAILLAAFDLVVVKQDRCLFGDAGVIRTASQLLDGGRTLADTVRILVRARDLSPEGRHRIVLTSSGEAALEWDDGLTTLEGQGWLDLGDDEQPGIDELFDIAMLKEEAGQLADAERLYDQCARADKADAISRFNHGNVLLKREAFAEAEMSFRRALERDRTFVEARYNLAVVLEKAGRLDEAKAELERVVSEDRTFSDAIFNLGQLHLKSDAYEDAKGLFERFLELEPASESAAIARKAILYCTAGLLL